jgi:hypothetical protein
MTRQGKILAPLDSPQELSHGEVETCGLRPLRQTDQQLSLVIADMQRDVMGVAVTRRATAGCALIRWLIVLVSSM